MAIDNAEAIRFSNEVVRPLAEKVRDLNVLVENAMAVWYGGMNAVFPNDTSAAADGREAEGVSRITGADVNSLFGQLATFATQMDGAGVSDVVLKPCVRNLSVG